MKQEDLIKFWTWCGFNIKYTKGQGVWYGLPYSKHRDLIGFPIMTLDILYQYAIPKLQDKGYSITLEAIESSHKFHVLIEHKSFSFIGKDFMNTSTEIESSDTPTEALYNAIMKVIDSEVKE